MRTAQGNAMSRMLLVAGLLLVTQAGDADEQSAASPAPPAGGAVTKFYVEDIKAGRQVNVWDDAFELG